MIQPSANQLWKESNTSLSFKDWLNREKLKGNYIPNKNATDIISDELRRKLIDNVQPKKNDPRVKATYGIDNRILIISGVIILGAVTYKYWRK